MSCADKTMATARAVLIFDQSANIFMSGVVIDSARMIVYFGISCCIFIIRRGALKRHVLFGLSDGNLLVGRKNLAEINRYVPTRNVWSGVKIHYRYHATCNVSGQFVPKSNSSAPLFRNDSRFAAEAIDPNWKILMWFWVSGKRIACFTIDQTDHFLFVWQWNSRFLELVFGLVGIITRKPTWPGSWVTTLRLPNRWS